MKWFFGVVVLLNLLAALWGTLKSHPVSDIHAQEVSPRAIRLLPADWGETSLNPTADVQSAASGSKAAVPLTKLVANLDSANASALLAKPEASAAKPAAAVKPAAVAKPAAKPVEAKPAETKAEAQKVADRARQAPAPVECYQWGDFDGKALERIKAELAPLQLAAQEQTRQAGHGGKFWVYYPDKAKAAELKAKGFNNYQVQNEGEFKGMLSLGLFSRQDGAGELVARLKSAGFADGRVAQRGGVQRTVLSFHALTAQQGEALHKLQQRMAPSLVLKSTSCS